VKALVFLAVLLIVFLSCNNPASNNDEDNNYKKLSLDDIKAEYREVDSLNNLRIENKLDTSSIERYLVIGKDIRNNQIVVRICGTRLFGCLVTHNVFDLFYEYCDSVKCDKIGGIKVIDYQGFTGEPAYIGCQPDTT
jgi:hypothetical protein